MSGSTAPRRRWTQAELAQLRELYPHMHTADVAAAMGRTPDQVYRQASALGVRKSRQWIAEIARERTMRPGHGSHAARFQPGHKTWNAGRPGSTGLHPNTKAHQFKPGQLSGMAARNCKPVGTLRINPDGHLQRKVRADGLPQLRWVSVHRLVWEQAHGQVPDGRVVAFKPGRRTTEEARITLDALELISRAENMRRNSYHHQLPPELARLVQLRGALSRQINKAAKADTA